VMTPPGGPYNALDQFEVVEEQPLCIHANSGGGPDRLSVRSIAKHKHSRAIRRFSARSCSVRIFSHASVYTTETASGELEGSWHDSCIIRFNRSVAATSSLANGRDFMNFTRSHMCDQVCAHMCGAVRHEE
jgi:hypothetical protein